jgi:hypothetical protein
MPIKIALRIDDTDDGITPTPYPSIDAAWASVRQEVFDDYQKHSRRYDLFFGMSDEGDEAPASPDEVSKEMIDYYMEQDDARCEITEIEASPEIYVFHLWGMVLNRSEYFASRKDAVQAWKEYVFERWSSRVDENIPECPVTKAEDLTEEQMNNFMKQTADRAMVYPVTVH